MDRYTHAVMALVMISCGPGDDDPSHTGPDDGATQEAASPRPDLGTALAYARQVQLPEPLSFIAFDEDDAVFRAADAPSFTERVRASVTSSDGERSYWLDLTVQHQADPLGFQAAGGMGGTGGLWDLAAELRETLGDLPVDPFAGALPDSIGVVRIGEDWWTLSSGTWSGPKRADYVTFLDRASPARKVSSTLQSLLWTPATEPEGREEVEGYVVDRYRFIDDQNRMQAFWNDLALSAGEYLPRGSDGELHVWMHESGLVVRAELRAEDAQGRVFEGRLELGGFGRPVEITPPI